MIVNVSPKLFNIDPVTTDTLSSIIMTINYSLDNATVYVYFQFVGQDNSIFYTSSYIATQDQINYWKTNNDDTVFARALADQYNITILGYS